MKEERYRLYEEHVNHYWQSIKEDIALWISPESTSLTEGDFISHEAMLTKMDPPPIERTQFHLKQFDQFCNSVHACLVSDSLDEGPWEAFDPQSSWEAQNDRIKFKAQVMGVLLRQWTWLKEVLVQLSADHPWHKKRNEGDDFVKRHYQRLYQSIPDEARKHLTPSSPLVFIGNFAALTHFKRKAPGVLSVPIEIEREGAFKQSRITPKIFHEIGHAVSDQLPGFLEELKKVMVEYWLYERQEPKGRQEEAIFKAIAPWLKEIIPYCVQTALAFDNLDTEALRIFLENTILGTIASDNVAESIPYPLIPYICLETAKAIIVAELTQRSTPLSDAEAEKAADELLAGSQEYVTDLFEDLLQRRFNALPGLSYISLDKVKTEVLQLVRFMLHYNILKTLGQPLATVLWHCSTSKPISEQALADVQRADTDEWGTFECEYFALDTIDAITSRCLSDVMN